MNTTSYIECVGAAGSGKTTVAKILVEALRSHGRDGVLREKIGSQMFLKIWLAFSVCVLILRHPSILFLFNAPIKKEFASVPHIHKTVRDVALRAIVDAVVIRYLLRRTTGVLINDESQVGKIAALLTLTQMGEEQAVKILRVILPKNTKLLFIEVSPEAAMQREAARNIQLPFFDDMEKDVKSVFFKQNVAVYISLRNRLNNIHGCSIISLNNSEGQDVLIKKVEKISLAL